MIRISIPACLALLMLFAIHTYFTFKVGSLMIPPLLPGVIAVFIVLLRPGKILTRMMVFALPLLAIGLICSIGNGSIFRFTNAIVRTHVYMAYSLCVGVAWYSVLEMCRHEVPKKALLALIVFYLVGISVERFTPLGPPMDEINDAIHARVVYESDERDLKYFGSVRPKFFATEPSYLAVYFSMIFLLYLAWGGASNLMLVSAIFVAGGALIMSPKFILIGTVAAIYCFGRENREALFGNWQRQMFAGVVMFGTMVMFAAMFATRAQDVAAGGDASTKTRIFAAASGVIEVAHEAPVFGKGLALRKEIAPLLERAYKRVFGEAQYKPDGEPKPITNALCALAVGYGVIGGGAYLLTAWLLAFRMGVIRPVAFVAAVFILSPTGAINGVQYWFIFFTLVFLFSRHGLPTTVESSVSQESSTQRSDRDSRQDLEPVFS